MKLGAGAPGGAGGGMAAAGGAREVWREQLKGIRQVFTVAEAESREIVFASEGFYAMTGYTQGEVLGHDCKFLQGPDTDRASVARIRAALDAKETCTEKLLNYKKDGSAFWNQLTISPLRGLDGELRAFVGVQSDVTTVSERTAAAESPAAQLISQDGRVAAEADSCVEEVREAAGSLGVRGPRLALDLATSIERIQSAFVVADARLPDCPIVFASDAFLELTDYGRNEVVGRNCRFLQGARTDRAAVARIREAVAQEQEVSVQILNYTKTGREFLNYFQMSPVRDTSGECRFFVGVQIDLGEEFQVDSQGVRNLREELNAAERAAEGQQTSLLQDSNLPSLSQAAVAGTDRAQKVSQGLAAMTKTWPAHLDGSPWSVHLGVRHPPPHQVGDPLWQALLRKAAEPNEDELNIAWFHKVKQVGSGDAGVVYLVELRGSGGHRFGLKALRKSDLAARNKIHRLRQEIDALASLDHPFLSTLYGCFETQSHVYLLLDFCKGGDMLSWLLKQPNGVLPEARAKWYVGQLVTALQYIHYQGIVHRDLKPENILLTERGHLKLSDFDLSFSPGANLRFDEHSSWDGVSELNEQPVARSNSFVGTAEFVAPEMVLGKSSYSSSVDWWGLGILTYEILFGKTPFKGKDRAGTFRNIARGRLKFPEGNTVSGTAKNFISQLLQQDPACRLGNRRGAAEVKQHPFFTGVRWALLGDARHRPPSPHKLRGRPPAAA